MNLQKQIGLDMVNAMKNKETNKVSVLRVLKGEFNRVGKELSDEEVLKVIKKMVENAKEFGYVDEFEILNNYLPKMLEPKEIKIIVENIINVNGFTSIKEMGQVMGKLKQCKESSLIDMKSASILVKDLLS